MVADAGTHSQLVVAFLVACVVAAAAGVDFYSYQTYNKTRDMFGRMSRSNWDRGAPPVERQLSYFPVDPDDELRAKAVREGRDVTVEFKALCGVNIVRKHFKEQGYEFRPPYYDEITCKRRPADFTSLSPNKCDYPFGCVQRRRDLFITRRNFVDGCWESVSVQVPSGCECMFQENRFGDIE